jgi:hypothetical protein
MSHQAIVFLSPSVSKLPDVDRKPFTTLRVNIIANQKSLSQKNIKKSLFEQNFIHKRLG